MSGKRDINAELLPHAAAICRRLFPKGTEVPSRNEYRTGDLSGGKGDSLVVSFTNGLWKDHNDSGDGGGNLLTLIANAACGGDRTDAIRQAREWGYLKDKDEEVFVLPLPATATLPVPPKGYHGYFYLNAAGQKIFYKYNKAKQPMWFGGKKGEEKLHYSAPPVRPLFALPTLLKDTDSEVVVAEGEKAAAALIKVGVLATTWLGGSGAWRGAEWNVLRGRRVLLWPDDDEAGQKCMAGIAAMLVEKYSCEVRIVKVDGMSEYRETKADAADVPEDKLAEELKNRREKAVAFVPLVAAAPADDDGHRRAGKKDDSLSTERAFLGAMLDDATAVFTELDKVGADFRAACFFDIRHQYIFAAARQIFEDAKMPAPDRVLIAARLAEKGFLGDGNGKVPLAYLEGLGGEETSAEKAVAYAGFITKGSLERRMKAAVLKSAETFNAEKSDLPAQSDAWEKWEAVLSFLIREENKMNRAAGSHISIGDASHNLWLKIEKAKNDEEYSDFSGAPTGLPCLDDALGGFRKGSLVVVAARPGCGKTAFALQSMIWQFRDADKNPPPSVLFFSLEMRSTEIAGRILSSVTKINSMKFMKPETMDTEDIRNLCRGQVLLQDKPIYIDDEAALDVFNVWARTRRMARMQAQEGRELSLVVVDYLQLLEADTESRRLHAPRAEQIARATRALKHMANELNVPVLALSQLNRDSEKSFRTGPKLSDLRDSGSIEQDADVVIFLENARGVDENAPLPADGTRQMTIYLAKNRHGPTGRKWDVGFKGHINRFAWTKPLKVPAAPKPPEAKTPPDAPTGDNSSADFG